MEFSVECAHCEHSSMGFELLLHSALRCVLPGDAFSRRRSAAEIALSKSSGCCLQAAPELLFNQFDEALIPRSPRHCHTLHLDNRSAAFQRVSHSRWTPHDALLCPFYVML